MSSPTSFSTSTMVRFTVMVKMACERDDLQQQGASTQLTMQWNGIVRFSCDPGLHNRCTPCAGRCRAAVTDMQDALLFLAFCFAEAPSGALCHT